MITPRVAAMDLFNELMITPEVLAKGGSESDHQKAFFCWCALNRSRFPELEFAFAIPNGGKRDKITAARMKAEGARPGVPDIFLPVPRDNWRVRGVLIRLAGLFIEMKVGKGTTSTDQLKYHQFLLEGGYQVAVCYSWIEAAQAVEQYLKGN